MLTEIKKEQKNFCFVSKTKKNVHDFIEHMIPNMPKN